MNVVGIGLDLCPVERMELAISRHGARFLRRIYTEAEQAYCVARARPAESFAARFAAKEATSKALGVPPGIAWHDVEVIAAREDVGAAPSVRLHGCAAAAARERGIGAVLISLTHAGGVAAAMAVAIRAGAQ